MPVTQISGISARNGHLGKPPPTGGISPQSQIVPSTLSCSNTETSPWDFWGATSIPETSEGASASLLETKDDNDSCASPWASGATAAVEYLDAFVAVRDALESCATARSRMRWSWPPFCR